MITFLFGRGRHGIISHFQILGRKSTILELLIIELGEVLSFSVSSLDFLEDGYMPKIGLLLLCAPKSHVDKIVCIVNF